MAANNQKNTRILLFLLLCIRMTLTVDANDFLFTSINTAQGLSDNQIRYILQPPGAFINTFSPVDHGVRLAFRVILPSLGIRFMAA